MTTTRRPDTPAGGDESRDPDKPVWRRPTIEELGNLRDFVQTGSIGGKSGPSGDGGPDAAGEMRPRN